MRNEGCHPVCSHSLLAAVIRQNSSIAFWKMQTSLFVKYLHSVSHSPLGTKMINRKLRDGFSPITNAFLLQFKPFPFWAVDLNSLSAIEILSQLLNLEFCLPILHCHIPVLVYTPLCVLSGFSHSVVVVEMK